MATKTYRAIARRWSLDGHGITGEEPAAILASDSAVVVGNYEAMVKSILRYTEVSAARAKELLVEHHLDEWFLVEVEYDEETGKCY